MIVIILFSGDELWVMRGDEVNLEWASICLNLLEPTFIASSEWERKNKSKSISMYLKVVVSK